jgi:hypothetical protein
MSVCTASWAATTRNSRFSKQPKIGKGSGDG